GSAEPYDYTRQLLALVAQAIADLPNMVSIRGHTDSLAYAPGKSYDNWNLSSERALASRRSMMEAGLAEARIEGVVGRADRDPLFPDHPEDPRNRRISIILLHEDGAGPAAAAGTTATAVEHQTSTPASAHGTAPAPPPPRARRPPRSSSRPARRPARPARRPRLPKSIEPDGLVNRPLTIR